MSDSTQKFDFIFAGAGLAGLSLAYRIKNDPALRDKRLLLVDPAQKNSNDRTWCFWSKENEYFDDILFKKWSNIKFASTGFDQDYEIAPYQYKMIRGIDFYNKTVPFLKNDPNTHFVNEPINEISGQPGNMTVKTDSHSFKSDYVFKSYYDKIDFSKDHFVWQHFKGWIVDFESPVFDENRATFMDFRVDQATETRFFYVLPFSATKALVEIAIFSKEIPEPDFYDSFLKNYINQYISSHPYSIEEEELGAIPMTSYAFHKFNKPGLIHIGTGGGSVKASSGYAFKRIQNESDTILRFVQSNNLKNYSYNSNRYSFYDKILLNVILSGKASGDEIFTKLFSRLSPQTIFGFLDEEAGFWNDLKIFTAPPTLPFLRAFIEEILA